MEPIEATIKVKLITSILTDVVEVKKANDTTDWVHFDGSRESLAFPKATFAVGDKVKITFERVT